MSTQEETDHKLQDLHEAQQITRRASDPPPSAPSLQSVAEGAAREISRYFVFWRDENSQDISIILTRHFAPLLAERDERIGRLERERGKIVTIDHPEANGRKALIGEQAYTLSFTEESGRVITVEMGKSGFETVTNLLVDMLSQAAPSDDLSTTLSPYWKLKAMHESAALRCDILEGVLKYQEQQLTALRTRCEELERAIQPLVMAAKEKPTADGIVYPAITTTEISTAARAARKEGSA